MAYRVEFLPEAAHEFEALDGSLKKFASKQIEKIAERPELGEALGNKMGIDLTGYRKIYFGKKGYRIVYEIQQKIVGRIAIRPYINLLLLRHQAAIDRHRQSGHERRGVRT